MKNNILLFLLLSSINVFAQKTVILDFDQRDFQCTDDDGYISIITTLKDIRKVGDTLDPALPYIPFRILVAEDVNDVDYSVHFYDSLLFENVRLRANAKPIHRNMVSIHRNVQRIAQHSVMSPVHRVGIVKQGADRYLYLKVTPFTYDEPSGNLYFTSQIILDFPSLSTGSITIDASTLSGHKASHGTENAKRFINDDEFAPMQRYEPIGDLFDEDTDLGETDEYLIITCDTLAGSFETLCNWKESKAINTKIVTTDTIATNYSGADLQEKIKSCIYDHYINRGTKWVLLGGDETIVPARFCKYKNNSSTPCDLYYACYNGTFNWNANGNSVYGELNDNIDMNPQVYLSRLPINSAQQIIDYTNKLMKYEQGDSIFSRMLLCGNTFGYANHPSGISDAQQLTEMIYDEYIQPYWNGNAYKLFDTGYLLPDNSSYYISGYHLQTEMNRAYNFVLENSHGDVTLFDLKSNDYTTGMASQQTNNPGSIVVSGACLVNSFDVSYPCLAETLIRNANGGVIAFFGNSRSGMGDESTSPLLRQIIYSDAYNGLFFQNLFTDLPASGKHSFGAVAAKAKNDLVEECYDDIYYRYLQLSINPIGDPEMQIFTTAPKKFGVDSPTPTYSFTNHGLYIDTKTTGCTVYSLIGGKHKYMRENVSTTYLNHSFGKIAITKPNYAPYLIDLGPNGPIGPPLFSIGITPNGNGNFTVSLKKSESEVYNPRNESVKDLSWTLTVCNTMTNVRMVNKTVEDTKCTVETTGWTPGIYAITANVYGDMYSEKFIIK